MAHYPRPRLIGRYLLCAPFASGGMATVHLGRLIGPEGFSRTVAIKRLHPQFALDPEFVTMFLDEARLASRIRHANVVAPLDVVVSEPEVFIVMDYVHGEPLSRLLRPTGEGRPSPSVASAAILQTLLGLHAAHDACDERGSPLGIVHRDISPQNILVDLDGVVRVVDFGVAKAALRAHATDGGKFKGKLGYVAPEQIELEPIDRRADVFAAGVVLWELLTGLRLFPADETGRRERRPEAPSGSAPGISPELDAVVERALASDPNERFADARQMALALQSACAPAGALEIASWVESFAGETLRKRALWISDIEGLTASELTSPGIAERRAEHVSSRPPGPERPLPDQRGTPRGGFVVRSEPGSASTHPVGLAPWARKLRKVALPGVIALGAASTLTVLAMRSRSSNEPPTVTALSPEPEPVTTPVPSSVAVLEQPAAPRSTNQSPPVPGVAALPAPSASAPPNAAIPPVASTQRTSPPPNVAPRATAARPTRPASKVDCKTPFTVDSSGIKRFRPECF